MQEYTEKLAKALAESDTQNLKQLYKTVSQLTIEQIQDIWHRRDTHKTACYFSAEFLIGRVIYANLYNLGLLEKMRVCFTEKGLDPNVFEAVDDAALGNGGLGRLAACFLDSAASCGYALDGYGIRYR